MAQTQNYSTIVLLNLLVLLSALLLVSLAEGGLFNVRAPAAAPQPRIPQCETVTGVTEGGTCFDISQLFNVSAELFSEFNPNLDCSKLFVGQWLCVAGA